VLVPPSIRKGDTPFSDTHPHSKPTEMTLPGILAWSSNLGTITIADRLGAAKLYEYQRRFGFGEPTGIGLPGEAAGLVQPPANWSEPSYGSIPIGMGVSVTPIQMASVYATIANGGVWVQPHLVKATIAPDGSATPAEAPAARRVISAENAAALRTMLEAVVTVPGATGLSAAVDGYRVAGKTGTGKIVRDGQYAAGEVASFIGIAPADAPRYVVAVFAHTPGGNGGVVAGPAFKEIMGLTLRHYRVPPTGTRPPEFHVYP
jgi:cell division protein FtsI (penicillin-binding protein 3)